MLNHFMVKYKPCLMSTAVNWSECVKLQIRSPPCISLNKDSNKFLRFPNLYIETLQLTSMDQTSGDMVI